MSDKPYVIDELISAKAIAARVEALAKEISEHFAYTEKLTVVGLLLTAWSGWFGGASPAG